MRAGPLFAWCGGITPRQTTVTYTALLKLLYAAGGAAAERWYVERRKHTRTGNLRQAVGACAALRETVRSGLRCHHPAEDRDRLGLALLLTSKFAASPISAVVCP